MANETPGIFATGAHGALASPSTYKPRGFPDLWPPTHRHSLPGMQALG